MTPKIPRRSTRERKGPIRYPKHSASNVSVHYCRVDTPSTFEEALNSNNCENWKQAMDKELVCTNKNKTWKLVDKEQGQKVLDVKLVYSRKSDDTYNARLVVRGLKL